MNLNVVFYSCQLVDFWQWQIREKSDALGAFNTLSKETPLDVGLLVLPIERVIEVVIVEVAVTSDSRDGSRSSLLLTMLRLLHTLLTSLSALESQSINSITSIVVDTRYAREHSIT